jgi:hypothetical protein
MHRVMLVHVHSSMIHFVMWAVLILPGDRPQKAKNGHKHHQTYQSNALHVFENE